MALQSSELIHLTGSTSGRNIQITATSSPGTAIHTAASGATVFDQLFLYAGNVGASACKLTLEFGGTASTADRIIRDVDSQDAEELLISGRPLNGGLMVRAYASTASIINIGGYVIRVTNE